MVSVAASRTGHAAHLHIARGSSILAGIDFANDNALSFQSGYTEAIKHFLLIGFLGMFVGAFVFVLMSFQRNQKMLDTITFLIAIISTGAYYCMMNGYGVIHKDEADGQVTIFWARYVDRLFTTPLILLDIALLVRAEAGETVMLVGNDILMVIAASIGATQLSPIKWIWWVISIIFFVLIFLQLFGFLAKVRDDEDSSITQGVKVLIAITFISWCIYPIMWVLGAEGLNVISIDFEVGLICLADIVSKLGFGFYLMFAVLDPAKSEDAESAERTSLV